MTMDKLFDGSDAHLLPGNAELIQRLNEPELYYPGNFDTPRRANALLSGLCQEAADALEAADKRIAELDYKGRDIALRLVQSRDTHVMRLIGEIDKRKEAERKLAVAREVMEDLCDWDGDLVLKDFCEGVLAQIGGDDAGS